MTLIDRAEKLLVRIDSYVQTRSLATEAARFRTRATQLTAASEELLRLHALQRAFEGAAIAIENRDPLYLSLAERAGRLREDFVSDPRSILATQAPLDQSFITPLRALLARSTEAISERWRQHVEDALGSLPEGVLRVLETLGSLGAEVRQIRSLQAEGQQIAAMLPDPDSVHKKLSYVAKLSATKAAYLEKLEGIPDEVIRFLGLAASRNATLTDLTSSVQQWLDEEGLLNHFYVVLGGR